MQYVKSIKNLIMKQIEEKKKMKVRELSREELENTFGGSWWEVVFVNGRIVFVFHPI